MVQMILALRMRSRSLGRSARACKQRFQWTSNARAPGPGVVPAAGCARFSLQLAEADAGRLEQRRIDHDGSIGGKRQRERLARRRVHPELARAAGERRWAESPLPATSSSDALSTRPPSACSAAGNRFDLPLRASSICAASIFEIGTGRRRRAVLFLEHQHHLPAVHAHQLEHAQLHGIVGRGRPQQAADRARCAGGQHQRHERRLRLPHRRPLSKEGSERRRRGKCLTPARRPPLPLPRRLLRPRCPPRRAARPCASPPAPRRRAAACLRCSPPPRW